MADKSKRDEIMMRSETIMVSRDTIGVSLVFSNSRTHRERKRITIDDREDEIQIRARCVDVTVTAMCFGDVMI